MKKQLNKNELKQRSLKREKIKKICNKVINIICYVLSALFIVGVVAFCLGSCRNNKKQNIDSQQESVIPI